MARPPKRSVRVHAFSASLVVLFVLLGARVAHATPTFPDVVASHLGLSASPGCDLCHAGTPARGTVTTPFGATLRSRGARPYDEAALRLALDALAAEKKDSDGDGAPDIDELRDEQDPNAGAGTVVVVPEYGCHGARGHVSGASPTCLALAALGAGIVLRRRRASRSA